MSIINILQQETEWLPVLGFVIFVILAFFIIIKIIVTLSQYKVKNKTIK